VWNRFAKRLSESSQKGWSRTPPTIHSHQRFDFVSPAGATLVHSSTLTLIPPYSEAVDGLLSDNVCETGLPPKWILGLARLRHLYGKATFCPLIDANVGRCDIVMP
jgi:hypothetical protein